MTVNGQKAAADIRFPDIEGVENPTDLESAIEAINGLKQMWRAYRHEYEALHREMWRDQNNVYKTELPAVSGGAIDFDIPLITNVDFSLSGSNGIQWTAGTVAFGGTTYTVNSGNVVLATSVYIDVSSLSEPVTLGTVNGAATIVVDRWYLSNRDGSNVHSVLQSSIMHAGLLQANTITATQIAANSITATEIASSTITSNEIAAGTITANEIAATTITATEIVVGTITADQINGVDLSDIYNDLGVITAGRIQDATNTNYYDITNGEMEFKDSANTKFLFLEEGKVSINSATGGTGSEYWSVRYEPTGSVQNVQMVFDRITTGSSGIAWKNGGSSSAQIMADGTITTMNNMNLTNCDVPVSNVNAATAAQGRMMYSNSSGIMLELAPTTNGFHLVLSGGIPAWEAQPSASIATGTYSGSGSAQNIAHGLGVTPTAMIIKKASNDVNFAFIDANGGTRSSGNNEQVTLTSTNIVLTNGSSSATNQSGQSYRWTAFL